MGLVGAGFGGGPSFGGMKEGVGVGFGCGFLRPAGAGCLGAGFGLWMDAGWEWGLGGAFWLGWGAELGLEFGGAG